MNDDKMAKEYNIEGGSVLHLVRGGELSCRQLQHLLSSHFSGGSCLLAHQRC
jgi:hypothetical protein